MSRRPLELPSRQPISLRSVSVKSTGGASVTVWSMPPPHHDRGAAVARRPDARLDDRARAHGVEREVDADAAGELLDDARHVVGGGIDDVGRAEASGHLPAFGNGIGNDDFGGARDARALHDRDADTTRPGDQDGCTFGNARRVQHRADAGLHRAADHARHVERRVGRDLDRAGLGRDDVLGEAAEPDAAQHGEPLTRQRRTPVDECAGTDRHRVHAAAVLATRAPVTRVAHGDRREHDLVAGHDRRHARADRVDDTRRLVAEHRRRDERERAVHEREIGMTHTAVRDAHPHLTGSGIFDVDVVDDRQRLLRRFEQRTTHVPNVARAPDP